MEGASAAEGFGILFHFFHSFLSASTVALTSGAHMERPGPIQIGGLRPFLGLPFPLGFLVVRRALAGAVPLDFAAGGLSHGLPSSANLLRGHHFGEHDGFWAEQYIYFFYFYFLNL